MLDLEELFKELKFDNEDMLELENQLADMVDFFRRNHLVDYYR